MARGQSPSAKDNPKAIHQRTGAANRPLTIENRFLGGAKMNKRILFSLAVVFLASVPALSQTSQSSVESSPAVASANLSKKAVRISGQVGQEGKTIVCDKDHRILKVNNPESLHEILGKRVTVKARMLAAAGEIFITSVKLVPGQPVVFHSGDSAFRR
jgi:hypothetical protein